MSSTRPPSSQPPAFTEPEPGEISVSDTQDFRPPPPGEFLGHPKGLWMLFGSEFWERFMYYGMRAILAPYVAMAFFAHLGEGAEEQASLTYGGYTAMVYMTGIAGGYVADRILGYQRSIMLGGAMMSVGMVMLLAPDLTTFLIGLGVVVVGNGLFKPNISTMVGKLYAPGDVRRDSGFTIFYMGINAGAFLAPIVCGSIIGALYGFRWGFFAAGMGMILGLIVFQVLKGWIGHVGEVPADKKGYGPLLQVLVGAGLLVIPVFFLLSRSDILGVLLLAMMGALIVYFIYSGFASKDKVQLHRYIAMLILFLANTVFWSLFEQAGSSLNFFARDYVDMPFGLNFTIFQSANPVFILLLAPVFAWMWPRLDNKGINPSIPRKFSLGLIGVAVGFYALVFSIQFMQDADGRVPALMLTLCYLLHTMGELCLSPIGLSMVTKLARPKEVGLAMGGWFLSIAMANYLAGLIAAFAAGGGGALDAAAGSVEGYAKVFGQLFWFGLGAGVFFLVVAPLINRLMHGVK
ncbi:MAG TPA: oligopeptide:H+ symporter [Xanthomonadaceae bacterium]|nr:oligopeptide:H+ symporter [Xanthomonadaceae bacterium]